MLNIENRNKIKLFIIGSFLGIIAFLLLYGFDIINVTNTEWLSHKGDLTQHYMGWLFYRNSDWYFPLGLMDTVTYPDLYSIIYSDSIPLLAVLFKALSPILPETFQYFGIWGMLCYALQGGFAAILLSKATKKKILIFIGSLFFIFSPWMFHRLYMHSSLAAHWLILCAMLICLDSKNKSYKTTIISWSLLMGIAAGVHIYFLPIITIFIGCNALYIMWLNRKSMRKVILIFAVSFIPFIPAFLTLYLLGAFTGNYSYASGGFGEASANLNFLFNSVGHSILFSELPNPTSKWHEESFGYLGLGVFVLLPISVALILFDKKIKDSVRENRSVLFFTILLMGICLIISTAPVVAFNDKLLFSWNMIAPIEWVLEVFRSLGRFVWPICYIIMYLTVVVIVKCLDRTLGGVTIGASLLIVGLVLQLYDLSGFIRERINWVKEPVGYKTIEEHIWDSFEDQYNHIYSFEETNWQDISIYAATHDKTMNMTYLARLDSQSLIRSWNNTAEDLRRGIIDSDYIYIFPCAWSPEDFSGLNTMYIYYLDGYYIAAGEELNGIDEYIIKAKNR